MEGTQAHNKAVLAAQRWLEWDTHPQSRAQVADLLASYEKGTSEEEKRALKELQAHFLSRISFGTAGLRGRMAPGFANMNHLTVIQASQGLCKYLEQVEGEELKTKGVVVGRDHRHNSKLFAELTAAAFLSRGVRVYLFDQGVVATPFVPYAVTLKGACAGIMVTASHNPKDDNGYKVYWKNGCQIVSPHDKGIAAAIENNLAPWEGLYEDEQRTALFKAAKDQGTLIDPTDEVVQQYYRSIAENYCYHREENEKSDMKIVFTPMHGVGKEWVAKALEAFGLPPYIAVPQQIEPDPDFPTVAFPNPEEGKGALKLAMETADSAGASLIIANDPDSDRLAIAEKNEDSWTIFNGNQIGILLAHWVWQEFHKRHPDVPAELCVMLNTTVSSKMLAAMAVKEGLIYEETLTGFKWLGNLAEAYTNQGKHFLFAFEEAIGYMVGNLCLDKDGVRAAAVFAEMANFLRTHYSRTCLQQLNLLYEKYGYFATQNSYFFCYNPVTMDTIFRDIRNDGKYSESCGPYKIKHIRDLTTGYDSSQEDHKAKLPVSSSTHMITFYFENGCVATLRGSGTEPKLKYYVELNGSPTEKEQVRATLNDIVQNIISQWLRPEHHALQPPAE
ncbi:Phosphoglucomutase [Balamuthia mandrillaris]